MAYQVLYRTYRPSRFEEVVGQEYVVKTLKNAIKTKKIAHAYLFCGPRGTGKTTIAKLFAKAINCENFNDESCDSCSSCMSFLEGNNPDIIELDAASNNKVEEIRQIIDEVPYAPLISKYKVYIIDEVHMLTTSAFNALLKTLEEPPSHIVFILATTDPQKIIPTVLSRCQKYNFNKLTTYEIKKKMSEILTKENIVFEDKALDEIAILAEGGMRDALSILEQCLSYNDKEVTLSDVENIFGLSSMSEKISLLKTIEEGKSSEAVQMLRKAYEHGIDMVRLASDLLEIIKETIIYHDSGSDELLRKITKADAAEILSLAPVKKLFNNIEYLENTLGRQRQNQNFISYLELCLIKMARKENSENTAEIRKTENNAAKEEKTASQNTEKQEEATIINKPEIILEVPEVTEEELPAECPEKIEFDTDYLLGILNSASKEEKISASVIFNKLELYRFDSEKRKFYQLLTKVELFASSNDAMIVVGDRNEVTNINLLLVNKEIYAFFNSEFGVDKMIFAITDGEKNELISRYRSLTPEERKNRILVKKYELKEEKTKEDKIRDFFGKVRVEE